MKNSGARPGPLSIGASSRNESPNSATGAGDPQQNAQAHQGSRTPTSSKSGSGSNQPKPGTPVWSHDGIICTGESYKKVVKLTFAKGASLKDPARLFNSSLDGNVRRAIDIHEGEEVDGVRLQGSRSPSGRAHSSGKSKAPKKAK